MPSASLPVTPGARCPRSSTRRWEKLRRQSFLKGLAEDFAALRSDPAAWQDELEERETWDATLGDDLEKD